MIQTDKSPVFNLITGNEGEERPSKTVVREFEEAISESEFIREVRTDSYIVSRLFFRLWKSGLLSGIFKNQLLSFFKLIYGSRKNYLIVLMGPRFPKCFPYIFRTGLKAIYLFDAWPSYFNYILKFVNDFKIDYLFVSSKQAAESLNKLIGKNNVFWVPEGVKPGDYKFLSAANRNIDVLSFGRNYDNFHLKIVEKLALKKVNYIFSSANEKLFPDKKSFTDGLSGAKISVCFPTSITHPERAGGIETMTNRFLQSMASKCLVLGKAPEEMIRLFGYNPVVEVNMENPAKQIIEILENYKNYSELIEKNYKTVVENHTWSKRWEQISTILSENINQNKNMKQELHRFLNSILIKFGFELLTFPGGLLKRRIELLKKFNINFVFDVGANTGQYSGNLRQAGYKGEILSFEPLNKAFFILKKHILQDENWKAEQIGLGNFDGESMINVSENSVSSSILNIRKEHIESVPESKYISQENITIRKLDSIFNKYEQKGKNYFLKIDTQGFEKEVINGALQSLDKITGIQVEMSLVELYEGESMYDDLKKLIESYGFELYSLEPGFSDPDSGKLMQIDGIFFKNK